LLSYRIAIASANGSGKSSLAKAILDNGKLFFHVFRSSIEQMVQAISIKLFG